jgi:hypothetical protein
VRHATEAILRHFRFEHLQVISEPFCVLANDLAWKLDGPELTVALRKLLESKDCAVRAAL